MERRLRGAGTGIRRFSLGSCSSSCSLRCIRVILEPECERCTFLSGSRTEAIGETDKSKIVPLHVSSQLRRISSLPSWFRTFRNVLCKIPLVPFGIFGAVAARTVRRIFGLFENRGACRPCPLEVRIHVIYVDVKALRCLTKPFRILILGTRVTHHD